MGHKNNVFFLLFFIFSLYNTSAQSFVERLYFDISAERATLLPHHKMMYPLAEEKFNNVSANFYIHPKESSYWRNVYKQPETGFTLLYSHMSSERQLGKAFAIMPFMKFALNSSTKYQNKIYFGCGISYLTKTYDRLNNYKNIAIGSNFNAALRIFYSFEIPISNRLNMVSGFGITHFSNGAIKLPNRGANQISLSFGLKLRKNFHSIAASKKDSAIYSKLLIPEFYLCSGIKQLYLGDLTKYSTFTFGSALSYKYRNVKAAVLGLDFFYDTSDYTFYKDLGNNEPKYSFLKSGVYIGHQWFFNKILFSLHFGTYVFAKHKIGDTGNFYNRLVLRYQIFPNLELNSSLKAHFAKADYIEWGIVYHPFKSFIIRKK